MFGRKQKLRNDLPAIDLRKKPIKGLFGKVKWVPTTKKEQRKMKALLMKRYPDRYYADDLKEWNSYDELQWIDRIEELDALLMD